MAKIENTMECLEVLIDKMLEKGISKLSYSDGNFDLTLETPQQNAVYSASAPVQTASAVTAPLSGGPSAASAAAKGNLVKSPIVGTYYSAPAPDKAPFVTVGQKVKKGDTLMIIESMKLMNEINSEFDGTVAEIMVSSGAAVEFDQPIMRIE